MYRFALLEQQSREEDLICLFRMLDEGAKEFVAEWMSAHLNRLAEETKAQREAA